MRYDTDKPIEKENDDLLGRTLFSKQLGKSIYDYRLEDGLVIGLFGEWGSGKTSIINIAIKEVENLSVSDENKPLIMRFAPWNYSDKNNLISIFFQNLKSKINLKDNEKLKKQIGEALNNYSDLFDAASFIPVPGINIAVGAVKSLAKRKAEKLMANRDLESTKNIFEKALVDSKQKIVVIIDDIDRLTNSQIKDVFQLVKQVADFPNIIYLLAMDRRVVCNALSQVNIINANEYLEKIIQIPLEVPKLRQDKLNKVFFSKIEQIIKNLPENIPIDNECWNHVFYNCIEPYLKTLRDVNRVINVFQFRYETIYQEISFEDAIALTTIEVLVPQLFKWIANNKNIVCSGVGKNYLSKDVNKNELKKIYYDEFDKLEIDPEQAINCVSTIFPVFAKEIGNYYNYGEDIDANCGMHVFNENIFNLYFMFDLDDIKIPRSVINNYIYQFNYEELMRITDKVISDGNINYLLTELKLLINEIPYNRIAVIVTTLFNKINSIKKSSLGMFSFNNRDKAEYLVIDLIKKIKTKFERQALIETLFLEININTLGTMARLIQFIEVSHGRMPKDSARVENQIIETESLEKFEIIFVQQAFEIIKNTNISDIEDFDYIFYLLDHLDKAKTLKYVEELFDDESNKLRFVCTLSTGWIGTKGRGWNFHSKMYSDYITDKEIYRLIKKYSKNVFDIFNELEQIKLACFFINYNGVDEHANEESAKRLLEEWKKG